MGNAEGGTGSRLHLLLYLFVLGPNKRGDDAYFWHMVLFICFLQLWDFAPAIIGSIERRSVLESSWKYEFLKNCKDLICEKVCVFFHAH